MGTIRDDRTKNFFQEWTEQSAYVLGFWWADGNIHFSRNRNQSVSKKWAVYNTNRQILDDIAAAMGTEVTLQKKGTARTKPLWQIVLSSGELFDSCFRLTGTLRKSHVPLDVPDVPKAVFRHFVRGYFDGDGSIYWRTYRDRHGKTVRNLSTSFTAGRETGDFLERFRDAIRRHIPVGKKKIVGKTNRKLIFHQYDSMLLCEWMYRDASFAIGTKRSTWEEADKERLEASKKFFSNKI